MIYNCANWADLPWTEVRPGVRRYVQEYLDREDSYV